MADQIHNFLYSCVYDKDRGHEQFVAEHAFGILLSGESHMYSSHGTIIAKPGSIGLMRRNQLAKSYKYPGKDGKPFKAINIFLDQETLKQYASANNIEKPVRNREDYFVDLTGNEFLKGYFDSLMPYFDKPDMLTPALSELKTNEAIALLLSVKPALSGILFDFSEPHKIDLEAYMNQHYSYNVPLEKFARLTGRSLATFKRDFQRIFNDSPGHWLTRKRLEEAYFLIKKKSRKPSDIYLDLGFENLSHFSYAFKKQYGHAPSGLTEKP